MRKSKARQHNQQTSESIVADPCTKPVSKLAIHSDSMQRFGKPKAHTLRLFNMQAP